MTAENGTAITPAAPHIQVAELQPIKFTPEQRQLILNTCCGGASESEAQALVAIAESRGLNPIAGECFFVERWSAEKNRKEWAVQASIDSFRISAEKTGLYAGQDEPEYEYDREGRLVLARVRVWRRDWTRPCVGVARYDEYVQLKRDGTPTRFWTRMPHNQLAKCAEVLAMRKAFPKVFARIYAPEEMQQSEEPAKQEQPRAKTLAQRIRGRERTATADEWREEIAASATLDDLKTTWRRISAEGKEGALSPEDLLWLQDVTKARKDELQAKQSPTTEQREPGSDDVP